MERKHLKPLLWVALVVGGGLLLLDLCFRSSAEHRRVRGRYEAMEAALRAGDTNAARLLVAPRERPHAEDNFGRLIMFAQPLGLRSGISINGTRARICPKPIIPRGTSGHTVEMIKVDDEWYFTGKISVF